MKKKIGLSIAIFGILALVGCLVIPPNGLVNRNRFSAQVEKALKSPEKIELYSLEAVRDQSPEAFHNWKVLGKISIEKPKDRTRLAEAIFKSVSENDGTVAMCFIPHHGIRVVYEGETLDLVICFQCSQIQVFRKGPEIAESVLTTASAEPILNDLLKAGHVPPFNKQAKENNDR